MDLNQDAFPQHDPPTRSPLPAFEAESKELPMYEPRATKEGVDFRETAVRSANKQVQQGPGGQGMISGQTGHKPAVRSVGSDASFERSPHYQKAAGRASSGPSGDGKSSQTPERSPSVPEFGEWKKNPEEVGGYTSVFDKLGQEGGGGATTERDIAQPNRANNDGKRGCCCPWLNWSSN
ncbi:hypothetical protein Nepgr_032786 [Nepenthes gracilis]|uniref:RIN4 pathogenic type III effector avirulence factor Avr cleavage site domain-containing protein n=1 Tax=Nepenthes gracilis TaxID=150966 RepID=A0AAD3Y6C7_NEPGR|nr:hypothetical protein Nepgr_032786 [Nepenthes gracilis]